MSFDIKIKKTLHNIKFNYMLNFKANKKLGSKNDKGESQNDGAGILFAQILENEDDGLINLIQLVDSKVSENDALEAIQNYIAELIGDDDSEEAEERAYNQIFSDLKEEMLNSGFFLSKIKKYINNLERAQKMLEAKETDESKQQAEAISELAQKMNNAISLSIVHDKD